MKNIIVAVILTFSSFHSFSQVPVYTNDKYGSKLFKSINHTLSLIKNVNLNSLPKIDSVKTFDNYGNCIAYGSLYKGSFICIFQIENNDISIIRIKYVHENKTFLNIALDKFELDKLYKEEKSIDDNESKNNLEIEKIKTELKDIKNGFKAKYQDYQIIFNRNASIFEQDCSAMLKNDYSPIGGVVVTVEADNVKIFHQVFCR